MGQADEVVGATGMWAKSPNELRSLRHTSVGRLPEPASPRARIALVGAHSVVRSTVHRGIESRQTIAVPQRRRGSSCHHTVHFTGVILQKPRPRQGPAPCLDRWDRWSWELSRAIRRIHPEEDLPRWLMAWIELEDREPNQGTPEIQRIDAKAVSNSVAFTQLSEDNEGTRYPGQ